MKTQINKHIFRALVLICVSWLMTGLAVDDEFYNEYRVFLKYRPTFQYYFHSPLGMQDMPTDYPAEKAAAYYTYRDFVLTEHWSTKLDWLAFCLVLVTVSYVVFTVFKVRKHRE